MTYVGKDGSIFGESSQDIDLSNYYTKAQAERQKYSINKNINMKNTYKLINYPNPTDVNDLIRFSDLSQYISLKKTARFVKQVKFTTTTPGYTDHTPFLIEFNYLLAIEFYKEGHIVDMRIDKWGYDMPDLGYNWFFSINLEDLHDLNQSRKEEYYPLGEDKDLCGSTISKQQIRDFKKRKIYDSIAMVNMTKKDGNEIRIESRGIQTDLVVGRWGGITCHNINLTYISDT